MGAMLTRSMSMPIKETHLDVVWAAVGPQSTDQWDQFFGYGQLNQGRYVVGRSSMLMLRVSMAPNDMAPNNIAPNNMAPNNMAPNNIAPNNMAAGNMAAEAEDSMLPGIRQPVIVT